MGAAADVVSAEQSVRERPVRAQLDRMYERVVRELKCDNSMAPGVDS